MKRGLTRPEPYYELGSLAEAEGQVNHAVRYYYMALESQSDFEPARAALTRLGRIRGLVLAKRTTLVSGTVCRIHSGCFG